ncbi:hypothetical protein [Metabacillus sp. Hm71]|uniref:hypothetical protein n=1 Tax=Metabacillus sp. Hm71 TaxID=3450743 RepID=UPI003F42E7AB
MANGARSSQSSAYKNALIVQGIKNPKKWLLENTEGATKRQGNNIKPIEVIVNGKPQYYMSYAEACYRILNDK